MSTAMGVRSSLVVFLLCGCALAQMSTLPAAKAISELPGPPKNPPIFSEMTAIMQGGLQFEDVSNLKGAVAKVEREESQTEQANPHPFHRKTILTLDEHGRLAQRVDEDSLGVSTTTNVWDQHGHLESQTVAHHRNDGKFADWTEWQKWSYDEHGRLSEFRAGRDKEQMNWFVNFKYDEHGRPLGYEDKAVSLVEISYAGNKVTLSKLQKYDRRKFFEQVQILDDMNRVVDLSVSDLSGGQLKLWYHVAFKYDEKGRAVEQDTDPFKLGSGDDYSPLPGKVTISYDDEKHTGEQKYYDPEQKLVLHTKFEFDRDGIPTKFHVIDNSGKEGIGSEIFVDSNWHSSTRAGEVEWEVIYDDHGNWTERRRWFKPADGSPRIMTRLIKQSIIYR
jgi:hypothetical protein